MRSSTTARLTEAQFQQQVTDLCDLLGWRWNHVRRSIGKHQRWTTATSVIGWPDLAIWGHGRFLLVELKTDRGKLTAAQRDVLGSLRDAGVDARVWRPRDWDEIEAVLAMGRTRS